MSYIPPSKQGTCASCGSGMWRGRGSQPQGRARCRPCRRKANDKVCSACGETFQRRTGAYCGVKCRANAQRIDDSQRANGTWHTQRRTVTITDLETGEIGDRVLTVGYERDPLSGSTVRWTLICEAHCYDDDSIATHRLVLDPHLSAACADGLYAFTLLIGPEPWRRGLGKKTYVKQRATHACPVCAVITTRPRYCSAACQLEAGRRQGRARYRLAHGIPLDAPDQRRLPKLGFVSGERAA